MAWLVVVVVVGAATNISLGQSGCQIVLHTVCRIQDTGLGASKQLFICISVDLRPIPIGRMGVVRVTSEKV